MFKRRSRCRFLVCIFRRFRGGSFWCKIGYEKEADKPDIQPARGVADRAPLRFTGKYRVNHDGMALRKDPDRALHKGFVNLAGNLRPVCALGQPIGFTDLK